MCKINPGCDGLARRCQALCSGSQGDPGRDLQGSQWGSG